MFAELVCYYTYIGEKVFDRLNKLYQKYGYVFDKSVSTQYSGLNAMKDMTAVVDKLKTLSIDTIGEEKVFAMRDYSIAKRKLSSGEIEDLQSPKTNAVYFELEGGSFVCVRPSGTEPKLKVYYSIKAENEQFAKEKFEKAVASFEQLTK